MADNVEPFSLGWRYEILRNLIELRIRHGERILTARIPTAQPRTTNIIRDVEDM